MAEKDVRFITIVGEQPVHVFRDGVGAEVDVPCTRAEYDALATGRAPTPPPGHTWLYSAVRAVYDVGRPRIDDCIIFDGVGAVVFQGGDPYRGDLIGLPEDDYAPRRVGSKLVTSKPVPSSVVVGQGVASQGVR